MIVKINEIKSEVKKQIELNPILRDNDNKLISEIWKSEIKLENMTAIDFLNEFSKGKLTSPESIRRARQKIQEDNELLRGFSYKLRKNLSEEVRLNINN